jgi:hypothetical protein
MDMSVFDLNQNYKAIGSVFSFKSKCFALSCGDWIRNRCSIVNGMSDGEG